LAHRSDGDRYRRWYGGEFYQAFQVLDSKKKKKGVKKWDQDLIPSPQTDPFGGGKIAWF
jgi:hypothetical protein